MFGMKSSPVHAPVFEEVTSEHIDKIIDYSENQDERQYEYATSDRWFNFAYFLTPIIFGIVFIVFLVVYLPSDSPLITRLLDIGLGFVGGIGIAFAYSNFRG